MPDPFHVPAFQEIPSDSTLQSGKGAFWEAEQILEP